MSSTIVIQGRVYSSLFDFLSKEAEEFILENNQIPTITFYKEKHREWYRSFFNGSYSAGYYIICQIITNLNLHAEEYLRKIAPNVRRSIITTIVKENNSPYNDNSKG